MIFSHCPLSSPGSKECKDTRVTEAGNSETNSPPHVCGRHAIGQEDSKPLLQCPKNAVMKNMTAETLVSLRRKVQATGSCSILVPEVMF